MLEDHDPIHGVIIFNGALRRFEYWHHSNLVADSVKLERLTERYPRALLAESARLKKEGVI